MTIHHDKLAYGKLASTQENVSEDRLEEMLKKLNGTEPEDGEGQEDKEEKATPKNKK